MIAIFKKKFFQILLGILWLLLIVLINQFQFPTITSAITQLDNIFYDEMVQLNWRPHRTTPQIAIINIDNNSIENEGRWPWTRNKLAKLIEILKKSGVVTIAFDMVMSEPEINYATGLINELKRLNVVPFATNQSLLKQLEEIGPLVDNDTIFAHSMQNQDVVLGFLFHNDKFIQTGMLPVPLKNIENHILQASKLSIPNFSGFNGCLPLFLRNAAQAGAVTNLPDSDNVTRHGLMLERFNNNLYPSLALATVMNYLMAPNVTLTIKDNNLYGIKVGNLTIPTNKHGQILIPYWGQVGSLNYYSASDILQERVNPHALQDTIAIIGSSMILLGDLHASPVAPSFPGVEIVGNMIQGMIGQQLISEFRWNTLQGNIYLILIGLFFAVLFSLCNVVSILLIAIVSIVVIYTLSLYFFIFNSLYFTTGLIISLIVLQAITNYVYLFIIEKRQKRKINNLFGQYVPESYIKKMLESPTELSMEGEERNMTVLFSDIRNFTSISEPLKASEVKQLLNTFFTPITELIFNFKGTIDKYVGDMIIAFWGAPIYDENHVTEAIECALKIIEQLPIINKKMIENKLPAVSIGIGLASGLMNVGDMGSKFRRAYTVLGDIVNLASRLQDLTKFYQVATLASDGTRIGQDRFVWRTIDKIQVKGRKNELTIYQPLGIVNYVSENDLKELEQYHDALKNYYACDWNGAKAKFNLLHTNHPKTYLYQIYLERIHGFIKAPPPKDWNGVYVHQHK